MKFGPAGQGHSARLHPSTGHAVPRYSEILSFLHRIWRLSHARVFYYLAVISIIQLINGLGVMPAIRYLFNLALEASDLVNVTDRTFTVLLTHPISVLLLLAIAIIALAAVGLQFFSLIVMVNRQQSGRPPSLREMFFDTLAALGKLLRYPSVAMMIYFFLALPLGGLGLSSVLIQGVGIPPFITREYLKVPISTGIYSLIIVAILWLNLRLILTLPLMVIGEKRPLAALGNSMKATHKNFFRYLLLVGLPLGIAALGASIMVEVLTWIPELATGLMSREGAAIVASLCIGVGHTLGFLIIGAATVVALQILVALSRDRLGLPSVYEERSLRARTFKVKATRVILGTLAFVVAVSVSLYVSPVSGKITTGAENTLVLAHRGYSAGGVENTLGALDAAAEHHADYVEADFQLTKDGHFVASHDSNLFMVSGVNRNIFDMTLKEVQKVTVREGGFTDRIPTMSQYLKHAKKLGIPVLVELKVTGHEPKGYLQEFLKDIDSAGTATSNIYHSLDAHAVSEIKRLRPELRVGLTVAMSVGQLPAVNCDFYTIEQASFRPDLLEQAHSRDQEVYVWTVNDESTIRKLLSLPVDGIVTDQVEVARSDRELVASEPASDYRVGYSLAYLDLFR
ncbi:glycerophosphoryl diester phosphodiesterase membrane domain-containing protein [Glutamicibacter sp. JC586]|uniref:glycerophosphoryl diester phosphodiesterase membrane domain-containing protein n=1 Tax=Glutamicibacter sp. JC586 TaxID=2590552 RepID=UPI002104F514|nr:glycerophosphodiester phosphodiesterase [Glutamicibacter sp. JC586]